MGKLIKRNTTRVEAKELKPVTQPVLGHYVYTGAEPDDNVLPGDPVYVYNRDASTVRFLHAGVEYYTDVEEFDANYAPLPDGTDVTKRKIEEAERELEDLSGQQVKFNEKMLNFRPHVDASGAVASDGAMVPAGSSPADMKREVAQCRNGVMKLKNSVAKASVRLKGMMNQQAAIIKKQADAMRREAEEKTKLIQAKMDELQVFIDKAEEAIWTINLYLGKDEEIHQLAKGKPTPAETPITVRQLVLFMDEECAAAADYADRDGIDANSIEAFDAWLTEKPQHLDQVLPEQKGVVALRVRRHAKKYGDATINSLMADANSRTYFLIRNGQNVYRIWASFDVGSTLVPGPNDFLKIFYKEKYDDGVRVIEAIKPGSDEYMAAMERADQKRQHFFRVALILQGLIDRTKIFQPLPRQDLNILNVRHHDDFLNFIYDGEMSDMLPSGLPAFDDWLEEANSSLCVGQRVVGRFCYSHGDRRYGHDRDDYEMRIHPPSARPPESEQLHRIERMSDDKTGFCFYYDRDEKIYRGWRRGYKDSQVRARCTVYRDDKLLLNFDAANVTVAAMEHYLGSRTDRHGYKDMIPLLKRALTVKRKERQDEEPFRLLLVGLLMKTYGVELGDAEAAVPELVSWWKFKNQTHRALLEDDKKAIDMIVAEFNVRRKRLLERSDKDDNLVDRLVDAASTSGEVLLIAHKRGNEYVVVKASNAENVFVSEQIWKLNRSSNCPADQRVRLVEQKDWCLVDARWQRWEIIKKGERWDGWIKDARGKTYLTDPERQQIVDQFDEKVHGLPIAVFVKHDEIDQVFGYATEYSTFEVDDSAIASSRCRSPNVQKYEMTWKRTVGGELKIFVPKWPSTYNISMRKPFWKDADNRRERDGLLLKEWPDNLATAASWEDLASRYERWHSLLDDVVDEAVESVFDELSRRFWDGEYAKYKEEYGDDELWEEHKSKISFSGGYITHLRRVIASFFDRKASCDGMTVGAVFEQSADLIKELDGSWHHRADHGIKLSDDNKDVVIHHGPLPSLPEIEPETDDD